MTLRRLIIAAIAPVVVYLLAAFVAWGFDPSEWTSTGRLMTAGLAVWLARLTYLLTDDANP